LAELGEATADDFPRRFKGVQVNKEEKLLESLAAVGVAIETTAGPGAQDILTVVGGKSNIISREK